MLRLLGDKKANKTENIYMAEIVFWGGGGVSEIQCLVYPQNPFEICNNWIQLNMVFHFIKIF